MVHNEIYDENVDHENQEFNENAYKPLQTKNSIFLHFLWRARGQFIFIEEHY